MVDISCYMYQLEYNIFIFKGDIKAFSLIQTYYPIDLLDIKCQAEYFCGLLLIYFHVFNMVHI